MPFNQLFILLHGTNKPVTLIHNYHRYKFFELNGENGEKWVELEEFLRLYYSVNISGEENFRENLKYVDDFLNEWKKFMNGAWGSEIIRIRGNLEEVGAFEEAMTTTIITKQTKKWSAQYTNINNSK